MMQPVFGARAMQRLESVFEEVAKEVRDLRKDCVLSLILRIVFVLRIKLSDPLTRTSSDSLSTRSVPAFLFLLTVRSYLITNVMTDPNPRIPETPRYRLNLTFSVS